MLDYSAGARLPATERHFTGRRLPNLAPREEEPAGAAPEKVWSVDDDPVQGCRLSA